MYAAHVLYIAVSYYNNNRNNGTSNYGANKLVTTNTILDLKLKPEVNILNFQGIGKNKFQ